MNQTFTNLHYTLEENSTEGQALELIVINNSDGTPRWICPAKSRKPHFLKFYNISGFYPRLFAFASRIVFMLGLQKLFFNQKTLYLSVDRNKSEPMVDVFQDNWALFMGTVGINNKTVLVQENVAGYGFYKIAQSETSKQLIANEYAQVQKVGLLKPSTFLCPTIVNVSDSVIRQDDLSKEGKRSSQFSTLHANALSEIYQKASKAEYPKNGNAFQSARTQLSSESVINDSRIPKGLLKKLDLLECLLLPKQIKLSLAHGDFTSWNMYVKGDKLAIYDWELSQDDLPLGFDAFHFIMQQGILVERKPWSKIKAELEEKVAPLFVGWDKKNYWTLYLKWYLYLNISKNLFLYANQKEWHTQVNWLLETWNHALADMISSEIGPRKLLLMDIFDMFRSTNYASIKFPDSQPECLSLNSDVDICVAKENLKDIYSFFEKHPLCKHIKIRSKSFMSNIQIVLKDGTLLSIDLIHKIMRKNLEMIDAKEVLEKAEQNKFGIKVMEAKHLTTYLGCFYGLNNSTVPEKYHDKMEVLETEKDDLSQLIYENHLLKLVPKKQLTEYFETMPINRGGNRIVNSFNYLLDAVKSYFSFDGLIVTFSGVDGAGKSTVIENIKYELEKKARKQVIVIRHRPSLLPILSAWTKGKAKAEQDAANTLPRQGKNSSVIGSMFRFLYYFTDFFFGQFFIYVKYVMRGYVVLYDRYYFDFINDSLRSNIQLPTFLIRFGYNFILSPDLNFFLYADADTILTRKKELSKETIEQLTNKYLSLFKQLDKPMKCNYVPIENIDLRKTLRIIMDKIIIKIA